MTMGIPNSGHLDLHGAGIQAFQSGHLEFRAPNQFRKERVTPKKIKERVTP